MNNYMLYAVFFFVVLLLIMILHFVNEDRKVNYIEKYVVSTPTPLLNQVTSATPVAAYSLKLVHSSNATKPVVKLRRSSDNVEQDFFATTTGILSTSQAGGVSFASWVGTHAAHVVIWYDQTGRGKHVQQTDRARQPRVLTDGTEGFCVYFTNNHSLTGSNVFDSNSVDNMHLAFASKEISQTPCALISLNGTSFDPRFSVHAPWDDRSWYFDALNYFDNRAAHLNATPIGAKTIFSGYKDPNAKHNGFRLNKGERKSSKTNTSAPVNGGIVFNISDFGWRCDHYVYDTFVFNKRLSDSDENLVENFLTKPPQPSAPTPSPSLVPPTLLGWTSIPRSLAFFNIGLNGAPGNIWKDNDYAQMLAKYPVDTFFYMTYKNRLFRLRFNNSENSAIRNTSFFYSTDNGKTWLDIPDASFIDASSDGAKKIVINVMEVIPPSTAPTMASQPAPTMAPRLAPTMASQPAPTMAPRLAPTMASQPAPTSSPSLVPPTLLGWTSIPRSLAFFNIGLNGAPGNIWKDNDYAQMLAKYPVDTFFYMTYKNRLFRLRFNNSENSAIRNTSFFYSTDNGKTWLDIPDASFIDASSDGAKKIVISVMEVIPPSTAPTMAPQLAPTMASITQSQQFASRVFQQPISIPSPAMATQSAPTMALPTYSPSTAPSFFAPSIPQPASNPFVTLFSSSPTPLNYVILKSFNVEDEALLTDTIGTMEQLKFALATTKREIDRLI
jgi:hypothetical protein